MNSSQRPTVFRKNVAVFVLNDRGEILLCERADSSGAWQLPQGGIESEETAQEGMFRELSEEIGTRDVEIIGYLDHPIRYDWPETLWSKGYCGQEQEYFLVRIDPTAHIDLSASGDFPEFKNYRWATAESFRLLVGGFKREAYLQALEELIRLFPDTILLDDDP